MIFESIIDGIIDKLYEQFGSEIKIYTEQVKQGFKTPCFFIDCVDTATEQKLGSRYEKQNTFCIHYFPREDGETNLQYIQMADRLADALEYITAGGCLTRGTEMHTEVSDGVFLFFVNYDVFVRKTSEVDIMEELEREETRLKG